VITTFDVLTEVILFALPVWLVSRNQISASKRRVVAFVFGFRLIVAASSIATMSTYFKFLHSGTARDSIGMAPMVVSSEVMLCTSLITASIPSLKSFLWAFMSRGVFSMYGVNTTASLGDSHGASIAMHSLARRPDDPDGYDMRRQLQGVHELRPEGLDYRVDIRALGKAKKEKHDEDEYSLNSHGSERMIIRRNIEFSMHEE
jgi:hypothetical protein